MTISTIGTWAAEGVTVSQVESALAGIRRHDRRAAVRTSVLTLVVVVSSDEAARNALGVVEELGARHPSRTVVLVVCDRAVSDRDEGTRLDASASVHVVERDGTSVCFEDVVLQVRGPARYHLDSMVEPFALPDLPVVVWLPSRMPAPGDPLLAVADRIVVDSRAVAEDPGVDRATVLPRIAALSRRLPVTDLSWARLAPWRSLLAGLFESPVYRPYLRAVDSVEVAGNFGPRYLLGGWLLRSLSLPPARVQLSAAEHVSLRITATLGGRAATFAVERPDPARVVTAWAQLDDGPCTRQNLTMRRQWPSLALAGALTRMGGDEVYREALSGALELLGPTP